MRSTPHKYAHPIRHRLLFLHSWDLQEEELLGKSWQELREMREASCTNTPPSWHFVFLLSGSNQQQKGREAEGFFFFFF
jgi:hypothetical protein